MIAKVKKIVISILILSIIIFIIGLIVVTTLLLKRINNNISYINLSNYNLYMNSILLITFTIIPTTFNIIEIYLLCIFNKYKDFKLNNNDRLKLMYCEDIVIIIMAVGAQAMVVLCNPLPYGFFQFQTPFGTTLFIVSISLFLIALFMTNKNDNDSNKIIKNVLSFMAAIAIFVFSYVYFYIIKYRLQFGKFAFDFETPLFNFIAYFPYLSLCMTSIILRKVIIYKNQKQTQEAK